MSFLKYTYVTLRAMELALKSKIQRAGFKNIVGDLQSRREINAGKVRSKSSSL